LGLLLERVFREDRSVAGLSRGRRAKSYHPAYRQALGSSTARRAKPQRDQPATFPGIDRDVAGRARCCHDIGKLGRFTDDAEHRHDRRGRLQGEIPIGY